MVQFPIHEIFCGNEVKCWFGNILCNFHTGANLKGNFKSAESFIENTLMKYFHTAVFPMQVKKKSK